MTDSVPLPLFACTQCGTIQTPPNGVQGGWCGIRRGLGHPPAKVCEGKMHYIGTVQVTPPHHEEQRS